jgi:hypothetical protein
MIRPELQTDKPLGRGLSSIRGDSPLAAPGVKGDGDPGLPYTPGNQRMAGSRIKGIQQVDPTFFQTIFPG